MKTGTKGMLIRTDGKMIEIRCDGFMQARDRIGCELFDIVRLENGADMWVDDCGRINNSPVNLVASILATERSQFRAPMDIFGDVIVFGHDGQGETIDFPDWVGEWCGKVIVLTNPYRTPEEESHGTARG